MQGPGWEELAAHQVHPTSSGTLWCWSAPGEVSWQDAPRVLRLQIYICIFRHAFSAGCPVATGGRGPTFPKSTLILEFKKP